MSSNYLWIFDNGHGGIIDGIYQTAGKRSPTFDDGRILFEGEFNRYIVNRLSKECHEHYIDHIMLVNTQQDVPLSDRSSKANMIEKFESKKCVMVSIHANAYTRSPENKLEFNTANGIETLFFQEGGRVSKTGEMIADIFQKHLIQYTQRRDRGIKGRNLQILSKTNFPVIITENGFMTNQTECELLFSESFREKIASAHMTAILEIEDIKHL
jgi:N-acetylmuramoyl-L-alanine amidase